MRGLPLASDLCAARRSPRGARFKTIDLGSSATTNAAGGVPLISTGTSCSGECGQAVASIPKTTTSWRTSPWRCQLASTPSRLKPTRSSATCERPLRVFAHAVSRSRPRRSNASAAIIAFDSGLVPLPHQRCPSHVPTVAWRLRRESSDRPVTPIGPSSWWTIRKSSSSPRSRFSGSPAM